MPEHAPGLAADVEKRCPRVRVIPRRRGWESTIALALAVRADGARAFRSRVAAVPSPVEEAARRRRAAVLSSVEEAARRRRAAVLSSVEEAARRRRAAVTRPACSSRGSPAVPRDLRWRTCSDESI
jgi:hypothetical protein